MSGCVALRMLQWLFLRAIRGAVLPLTPGRRHGDRPRSPTTDHDDNPLPTAGIATAPVPLPPTMMTAAIVASGAALPPLPLRPPLHWHFLMHTGGGRVLLACLHLLRSEPPTTSARIATRRRQH